MNLRHNDIQLPTKDEIIEYIRLSIIERDCNSGYYNEYPMSYQQIYDIYNLII